MLTLRTLPIALRVLFSSFLIAMGVGYLTAITYLFFVDIEPHREMAMGLVAGITMKYHGSTAGTRLEAALRGPMAGRLDAMDRDHVIAWIHNGATAGDYDQVKPIFDKHCVACHHPNAAMMIPSLASYDDIRKVAVTDTGPTIVQLARVSHIHLFGISIIFLLTGTIFALSDTAVWLRVSLVVIPYLAIVADIGSWWLTKFEPVFAWVVIIGGGFMGLALAGQILISLWQMWFGHAGAFAGAERLI